MVSGQNDSSSECRYFVWIARAGLGNRILSIASAFLYPILTNRVLLINEEPEMANLFCEPFPNATWLLPKDFPFMYRISRFKQNCEKSYGNMIKKNKNSASTELLPAHLYLYLCNDYDHHDKLFFCDPDQTILRNIPWLIMKSNLYFLPSLFLMSSFEEELDKLFPDKEMEKLLPQVDTGKSTAAPSGKGKWKAVLITSLIPSYYEKMKNMYLKHPTLNGEVVAVYQASHEVTEHSMNNVHNQMALAEINLLRMMDACFSHKRRVYIRLCGTRSRSKAKREVDTATLDPYLRHCEDFEIRYYRDVTAAKAEAIKLGIEIAEAANCMPLIIECDCQEVVDLAIGKKAVTLRSVWTRLHSGMAHSIAKVALESGGSMNVLHIFASFSNLIS
ncbi:hypothetical protein WN943_006824 [Citrus x changshan-huyou]